MPTFDIRKSKLVAVRSRDAALEKEVQKLTEDNLETVFGLEFVSTEFSLGNFRLDTLAFDHEARSFVIIEYKRDKSFSVIDQGYSYLALMLNNKADFILEYNERKHANLRKDDIDWSQSRILFLARSFTTYQQHAIGFRDLPIELWEVQWFENSTILYNQMVPVGAKESVKSITKNKTVESVTKEVRVYTVQDHLDKASEKVRDFFEGLRERILSLGSDATETPKKVYIAYKTVTNFADVIIHPNEIRIILNLRSGELDDPRNLAKDFTKPLKSHWGNGDYEVILRDINDISYVLSLVEQAYLKSKA